MYTDLSDTIVVRAGEFFHHLHHDYRVGWHATGDSAIRQPCVEFPEAAHSGEGQAPAGPSVPTAILPHAAHSALLCAPGSGVLDRQPPHPAVPAYLLRLGLHRLPQSGICLYTTPSCLFLYLVPQVLCICNLWKRE